MNQKTFFNLGHRHFTTPSSRVRVSASEAIQNLAAEKSETLAMSLVGATTPRPTSFRSFNQLDAKLTKFFCYFFFKKSSACFVAPC
jgi:hypothetical protein